MNNQRAQGGFTLIELVIVIVILGILAAVAVPQYLDLTDEAETAACEGVKGATLGSAAILLASNQGKNIGEAASPAQIVAATTVSGNITKPPAPATCTVAYLVNGQACNVEIPTDLCKI